jgi:UDP:flavonoid glycosyltransferase YjiC (YdhE family)
LVPGITSPEAQSPASFCEACKAGQIHHLAACDLALVQGGLTTCMELTAAGTPFIYFPLKNHFEQNFYVAHRLDRYGAGRRMEFATSTPEMIADAMIHVLKAPTKFKPVEADGAPRAAHMIADLI